MRARYALLLALPLLASAAGAARGDDLAPIPPNVGSQATPHPAPAEPAPMQNRPGSLQVTIDRAKVDLENHKLEVKLSRAAAKVKIKVFGQSGAVLAEVETPFNGAAPGTPLVMTWTPSSKEAVTKIEVYG